MPSLTTDTTEQDTQRRDQDTQRGDHLRDPLTDPLQSSRTGVLTRNQDPNGPRRQGMRDVRGPTQDLNQGPRQGPGQHDDDYVLQHHMVSRMGDRRGTPPDPSGFKSQQGRTQTHNTTGGPDKTGDFSESRHVRSQIPVQERVARQGLIVHGVANQLVQDHGTEDTSSDSGSSDGDSAVTSLMQAPDSEQEQANAKIARIAPMLGTPPSGAPGKLEDQTFQQIHDKEQEHFAELQPKLALGGQDDPNAPTQQQQKQQQLSGVTAVLPEETEQSDKYSDDTGDPSGSQQQLGQNSQQVAPQRSTLIDRGMSTLQVLDETVGRGQKGTNVQDVGSMALGITETEAPGVTGTMGVMSGLGGLALTGMGAKGVYDGVDKLATSDNQATTQHGLEQLGDNAVNVGRGGLMTTSGGMQVATAVGQTVESAPGLGLASGVIGTAVFGTKAIKGQHRKNKLAKVQTGDQQGSDHQQLDQVNAYAQEKMGAKATRNAVATAGAVAGVGAGTVGVLAAAGLMAAALATPIGWALIAASLLAGIGLGVLRYKRWRKRKSEDRQAGQQRSEHAQTLVRMLDSKDASTREKAFKIARALGISQDALDDPKGREALIGLIRDHMASW